MSSSKTRVPSGGKTLCFRLPWDCLDFTNVQLFIYIQVTALKTFLQQFNYAPTLNSREVVMKFCKLGNNSFEIDLSMI